MLYKVLILVSVGIGIGTFLPRVESQAAQWPSNVFPNPGGPQPGGHTPDGLYHGGCTVGTHGGYIGNGNYYCHG
ncbi:hypothetical protein [Lactiplantibacillus plantarum]|uniref:hypothetical protein n=1 Tax=Lactiplantibacillus plantarum TaxID=1590 RepID=UPI001AAF9653|nr:hypothetical protein [Lactiplantibacillus plantarum]MBO2726939.1 hypothetical protein [Lactiplantibacillus plantarum]